MFFDCPPGYRATCRPIPVPHTMAVIPRGRRHEGALGAVDDSGTMVWKTTNVALLVLGGGLLGVLIGKYVL